MRRVLLLIVALVFALNALAQAADLALLAASDDLLRPFREKLTAVQHETHGAWELWFGHLGDKSVVLGRTEGDPLNAVAVSTLALRLHSPRLLVVFGTARSYAPELKSGDIVVSSRFAAFDGMVSRSTSLNGGSSPLTWEVLPHLLMTAGEREIPTKTFAADKAAMQLALGLKRATGNVREAVLGSANQVNREADRITWLRRNWGVATEDGESAHVAGSAALFHVPIVGIRIIDGPEDDLVGFVRQFVEAWK
jgi:adenosylhomocysteine nucleosidase